jgi:hypothetical protein
MTRARLIRRVFEAIASLRELAGNDFLPRPETELYADALSEYRAELLSLSDDAPAGFAAEGHALSLLREAGDFARDSAEYDPEEYPDGPAPLARLFDATS